MYDSLLRLGLNLKADSFRRRLAQATLLIAGMMLHWHWEAELISYFAYPIKKLPYNNLEEFVAHSQQKVNIMIL